MMFTRPYRMGYHYKGVVKGVLVHAVIRDWRSQNRCIGDLGVDSYVN